MMQSAPLFPLNALVCPGGRIPLRIFEARYLDMVSECMKQGSGFVIVLLRDNDEADLHEGGDFYRHGTFCHIVDFATGDNDLLEITVEGQRRVSITEPRRGENGLWRGDIESLADDEYVALPARYEDLKDVLMALVQHPMIEALNLAIDYDDSRQVGYRLTELLPLDNREKQKLLEMNDPLNRLEHIADQLQAMSA